MPTRVEPQVRHLSRKECEALLARNHVGRLAYARANHVDVEPVHYVYADGWIYGRTSEGLKTKTIGPNWWPVAFEVDEIENLFRWRSVVVHGGLYPLHPQGVAPERVVWETAVERLRELVPETLREGDPFPHRTIVFRISAQTLSGREAEPRLAGEA